MSVGHSQDERAWEADKRDFVADTRDEIADARDMAADTRDAAADERERLADERESALDEREHRAEDRAAELGMPPEHPAGEQACRAEERDGAAAQRQLAQRDRDQQSHERGMGAAARETADKRRQASTPATGLAIAFAEIARYLYEADNFDDVLTRVVQTTVSTVSGCDMASITVREGEKSFRTLVSTHNAAAAADQAQYTAGEGPILDAIEQAIVHTPSLPDPRWPTLASRPADSGVEAIVSYHLSAEGRVAEDSITGSLNAYAGEPDAFDDEAQEIGLVLATHASVGLRAVRERDAFGQFGQQLHEALSSRDVIGQAKGILMERLRITPEAAFDTLRRASQRLNIKLREVAQKLAESGEFDDPRGN